MVQHSAGIPANGRRPDLLFAFLDSPDQKQVGVFVDKLSFNNNTLRLEVKRFSIVYEGQIQQNGSTIQGHWKQAGGSDPLVLGRFDTGPVVARPQNPKKPLPYNCEQIVYENESAGLKLAGTLTLPVQGGPFPAALLLQGSGPLDRNEFAFGHQPFMVLADYLTRHGIAVLRVDKRGIWQSTGDFSQATTADFAADALAAVEYLRTRKEINPKHIGLVGHSKGGIIAPMVAAQTDHVHFIVLLSAPGMDLKAGRLLQEKLLAKAKGMSEQEIQKRCSELERRIAIEAEPDIEVARQKARAMIKEKAPGIPESALNDAINGLLSPWRRYLWTIDQQANIAKVKCAILALNGKKTFRRHRNRIWQLWKRPSKPAATRTIRLKNSQALTTCCRLLILEQNPSIGELKKRSHRLH